MEFLINSIFIDSSYFKKGKSRNDLNNGPDDDEIRKNSHHHYWVPEDIMFIKGNPLKKALKHLEIKNFKKMKILKKKQYQNFCGTSKPSILPLRGKKSVSSGLEINGKPQITKKLNFARKRN